MADDGRTWWPFAAAAVATALIVTITIVSGGGGAQPKALTCPKTFHTRGTRPWVPARPAGLPGASRLAPERVPLTAVVCSYGGRPARPDTEPLQGRRKLDGDLDALADTAAYLPPKIGAPTSCGSSTDPEHDVNYLLGLTYVGGTEWVAVSTNGCAATPTTNGEFYWSISLDDYLAAAYRAGHWVRNPPSRPADPCRPYGAGRRGQETTMVPAGATSVDACRLTGSSRVTKHVHADKAHATSLAAALDKLSHRPDISNAKLCITTSGVALSGYEATFHYDAGTDVSVAVMPGCGGPVDNGSIHSGSAASIVPLLRKLLA